MKRPTLKTIAQLADVSHMTVSLALRGHPSIPEKTRHRIHKIAKKIGYRPNPYLSVLMSNLRMGKAETYQATLAALDFVSEKVWKQKLGHVRRQMLKGAEKRARALGFHLEVFWANDPQLPLPRLSKMLKARGTGGVLFLPSVIESKETQKKINLNFNTFPCATAGVNLTELSLPFVQNDQYTSAQTAHLQLLQLGYRKIGLATNPRIEEMINHRFTYGFLSAREFDQRGKIIPIFKGSSDDYALFQKWISQYRPDAVLGISKTVKKWLEQMGVKIPKEIGFACLDYEEENGGKEKEIAGIRQNHALVGESAIDAIVGQIHLNERGSLKHPKGILIPGEWIQGKTVRKQTLQ